MSACLETSGYNESLNGKLRDELLNTEVYHIVGSLGPDRAMEPTLQYQATTLGTRILTAGAGNHLDQPTYVRLRPSHQGRYNRLTLS